MLETAKLIGEEMDRAAMASKYDRAANAGVEVQFACTAYLTQP